VSIRARARWGRLLAVAAGCSLLLGGCGSGKEGEPIPRQAAATLQQRLDVIQRQFTRGGGACTDIQERTFPVVERDLRGLPRSVDGDVRAALEQSFARLRELTSEQCDAAKNERTKPETTPQPSPLPPAPTTTSTQPETTTGPSTETTPKPEKPGKGKGKANGKGKGEQDDGGGSTGGSPVP
jgi:hypothetical protein